MPDPPDRGSLFHQAGALVPSGAIHSRVVIEFGVSSYKTALSA